MKRRLKNQICNVIFVYRKCKMCVCSNGWFKSVQYWCILLKYHFKDGGKVSTKVQTAFIIPAVLQVNLEDDKLFMAKEGTILCIFISWNIFEHLNTLQLSSSPPGTCCTYFRWFMIARLEEYTLLQLTLKNGKFLTPDKNISNASRKGKYFKHGLFDIQCFFLRYLMSDRVWWFLLSPSNQFCHHKSFSMFFLWQLSLGKKNTQNLK